MGGGRRRVKSSKPSSETCGVQGLSELDDNLCIFIFYFIFLDTEISLIGLKLKCNQSCVVVFFKILRWLGNPHSLVCVPFLHCQSQKCRFSLSTWLWGVLTQWGRFCTLRSQVITWGHPSKSEEPLPSKVKSIHRTPRLRAGNRV